MVVSMVAGEDTVFALYHLYNRTILLGFICILNFHFKIVLVLRRRYLIPIRCNNGKRKMWPWRWLHHFDFQHWRWLHPLMTMVASCPGGYFLTHTHGWGTPFRREVYRCDFCNRFVLTFVTVSMRPRQTAATHQLKMVTAVTGIKKCYIIQLVTLHRYVCIPAITCRLHNIF